MIILYAIAIYFLGFIGTFLLMFFYTGDKEDLMSSKLRYDSWLADCFLFASLWPMTFFVVIFFTFIGLVKQARFGTPFWLGNYMP